MCNVRFVYLIDEDCQGVIYREDYYLTLTAYGVNSETVWMKDQSITTTFEQQYKNVTQVHD